MSFGMEYIFNKYKVNYSDFARELDINKANISAWLSGRREIPEKYLSKLESKFRIDRKYFNKQLTRVDELEIDKQKLINESAHLLKVTVEKITDSEGEVYTFTNKRYPDDIQSQLDALEKEIDIQKVILKLSKMLYEKNDNFTTSILENVTDLLVHPKVNKQKLCAVLNGFSYYYGLEEGFISDTRKLVTETMIILRKSDEWVSQEIEEGLFSKEIMKIQNTKVESVASNLICKLMERLKQEGYIEESEEDIDDLLNDDFFNV